MADVQSPWPRVTLVLGGARSGKSSYAERLVDGTLLGDAPRPAMLIATADPADSARHGDAEMAERIAAHRARRGAHWATIEEPIDLATTLRHVAADARPILVDCLTLWLSNLLLRDRDVDAAIDALAVALSEIQVDVALVANEVGLGIVPDNALARRFRDDAGRLNMRLARQAARVVLMVAGVPVPVKGALPA
ncbi:MAG: bifunctional adenosylcobinamide kinase/adenosylcobinamide-phosphate guanylyltransferase [Alphaproteobacteria bacterium]|nr:bifunctional adenosylcobinamide kinase/adenosylcobinamide-phosphate guanylyltransferase [Alphaproteobacteria bacterium]